jgi:signal peptide peptidase SppA
MDPRHAAAFVSAALAAVVRGTPFEPPATTRDMETSRNAARRTDVGRAAGGAPLAIAVLPVIGPILHRPEDAAWFGGVSTLRLRERLATAVNDPSVGAIVLNIDSPGGIVDDVPELAAEILAARAIKPIIAVANTMAASAAYWLASAASELVVTPSGDVGSIGVWTMHADYSKFMEAAGVDVTFVHAGRYKVEGNPYEPLGETAQTYMQSRVDFTMNQFVQAVATGRGVTPDVARGASFGEGRMRDAYAAKRTGMADRVASLDETLARVGTKLAAQRSTHRADDSTPRSRVRDPRELSFK